MSSFHKLEIKNTIFISCSLKEVDFEDTDLSGSNFENCDLSGAVFGNTNLEKVDFTTAFNYTVDPVINNVKKARFSIQGLPGLLSKFDIIID